MQVRETLSSDGLSIEFAESDEEVRLTWLGRSNHRQPSLFLAPVMLRALERSDGGRRTVVMDFAALDYMNSSSFTPVVKLLDQAARGAHRVRVEYSATRRWQAVSFAALKAFETRDGRVSVHAR